MKAVHTPGLESSQWDPRGVPQGAFEITTDADGQRWFWFKCPGPCKNVAPLALRPVQPSTGTRPSWELSGTPDAPTLQPSINHVGCWHGWLTDGVFKSC